LQCAKGANALSEKIVGAIIAPADRWQSYFGTPPFDEDGCEYFWDVNEK
jgi:hypothetical protein